MKRNSQGLASKFKNAANFTKGVGQKVLRQVWSPETNSVARGMHNTLGINSDDCLERVHQNLEKLNFQIEEDTSETLLYHCENYINLFARGYSVENCILVTNYRLVDMQKGKPLNTIYFSELDPNSAIEHQDSIFRWDSLVFKLTKSDEAVSIGVYERKKAQFLLQKVNVIVKHMRTRSEFWTGCFMLKEGWLEKEGSQNKNWKRRFFRLTDHRLSYYDDMTSLEALSHCSLIDSCCEGTERSNSGKPVMKLTCQEPFRELFICGRNDEENKVWSFAIQNNVSFRKVIEDKSRETTKVLDDELEHFNNKIAVLEQQLLDAVPEDQYVQLQGEFEELRKKFEQQKLESLAENGATAGSDAVGSKSDFEIDSKAVLLLKQEMLTVKAKERKYVDQIARQASEIELLRGLTQSVGTLTASLEEEQERVKAMATTLTQQEEEIRRLSEDNSSKQKQSEEKARIVGLEQELTKLKDQKRILVKEVKRLAKQG